MLEFLAERYEIGSSPAEAADAAERLAAAAEALRSGGARLEFLGSRFVPVDETSLAVFAAESAEVVERAHRHAGVPFERVVETVPFVRGGGKSVHS